MTARLLRALALLTLLAPAAGAQTLLSRTEDLTSDFESLQGRVDACPGGACAERDGILADVDAAESDRAAIHSERAALGTCSCATLDSAIATLDALASDVVSATINWEETLSGEPGGSTELPGEAVLETDQRPLDGERDGQRAVALAHDGGRRLLPG